MKVFNFLCPLICYGVLFSSVEGQSKAGTTIEPIVRIMDPHSKNITALVNTNVRLSCSVEYKPAQSSVRWFWGETMVSQDEWSIDPYMYRLYKPEINSKYCIFSCALNISFYSLANGIATYWPLSWWSICLSS